MNILRSIPAYIWTLLALLMGITLGGILPETFAPIAAGMMAFIKSIISIVPLLIFAALSPAFATLGKRGLAGKFATSVILWFIFTSTLAGLFGLIISALIFGIPFSGGTAGAWHEIVKMLQVFKEQGGASYPLLAVIAAAIIGIAAVWIGPLYAVLKRIEKAIGKLGRMLGYFLIPILLCLGLTIGVRFGAKMGMRHLLIIAFYTFSLCFIWCLFYFLLVIKLAAKGKVKKLVTEYFLPTALFAAGTTSSLVTSPINLINIKKYGVREEVADFVISFGAVANMNASAIIGIAWAPFLLHYVFGIEISWMILLIAWPALVIFAIAAPGLPAGLGTSLWASTLFASMLGLEEPIKSSIIAMWVALYAGVPDMFITATNCTTDGFSAILFDKYYNKFLNWRVPSSRAD